MKIPCTIVSFFCRHPDYLLRGDTDLSYSAATNVQVGIRDVFSRINESALHCLPITAPILDFLAVLDE
jgi:hypothetical protein